MKSSHRFGAAAIAIVLAVGTAGIIWAQQAGFTRVMLHVIEGQVEVTIDGKPTVVAKAGKPLSSPAK